MMENHHAHQAASQPEALRLANNRLGALRWGRSDAPVWLALHGWLDNAASFSRLAPLLVEALDIQVIALEFSGHGHSLWRPAGRYFMWDYAEDAVDAMAELALASPVLLGHSLGAAVAVQLAGALPERVGRLVLIDGLKMKATAASEYPALLKKALLTKPHSAHSRKPYRTFEQALWARVAGAITPVDEVTIAPVVERNLRRHEGGLILRSDSAVGRPAPASLNDDQWQALLRAIRCRVDIIAGSNGILTEESRQAARALRHHHWHALTGGHHLHLEPAHVKAVAALITRLAGH